VTGPVRHLGDAAAEDAPALEGHLRLTLLDDDGAGCTAYFPSVALADLLAAMDREKLAGRTLRDLGSTAKGWARLRERAFRLARERQDLAAGMLGLWCAMNGPAGPELRREVSAVLARAGKATVTMQRDRGTRSVATIVSEDFTPVPGLARLGAELPSGTVLVAGGTDDAPPTH
jgi:hypothetical protein